MPQVVTQSMILQLRVMVMVRIRIMETNHTTQTMRRMEVDIEMETIERAMEHEHVEQKEVRNIVTGLTTTMKMVTIETEAITKVNSNTVMIKVKNMMIVNIEVMNIITVKSIVRRIHSRITMISTITIAKNTIVIQIANTVNIMTLEKARARAM
jgi:hypothetical protein